MNIFPIHNENDYDMALKRVDQIKDAKPKTKKGDELDVLLTLIQNYEETRFPIDPASPIEAIKFRMEQGGLKQKDLISAIGTKTRVSEILNRKRPLTLPMAQKLHAEFHIPADALLKPYDLKI